MRDLRARLAAHRVPAALVGVSLLALGARLYQLGARVFYYDEAWFGYWVLKFLDHGRWTYRPILHGPFFARVNAVVFPVLGVSDATARLVVAVIGGLLPLSAWLYRDHLADGEVVALALALACNPVLLYYSRVMRKDVPLAAFMFVTLGLLVRAAATRRRRYCYGAGMTLGVAFATKESVLLWLLTWVGAALLVADQALVRTRVQGRPLSSLVTGYEHRLRSWLRHWGPHVLGAGICCLAVVVYFYAPRAGPGQDIGLWRALTGAYGTLPAVLEAATVDAFRSAVDYWVLGGIQTHPYLPYLGDTLATLGAGALGVSLLAVVGFCYDRYGTAEPRPLVAFSFYCGLLATIGYPLANNLPVPWSTVHAIVPLTVPAAVGGVRVYRWGRGRLPARDARVLAPVPVPNRAIRAGLAAMLLTYPIATMGATAVHTSYLQPHESPDGGDGGHEIIYEAQAPANLTRAVGAIRRAAATGGTDTDVLYVNESLAMDETAVEHPPATGAWHARIPLPWYTEAVDADVASVAAPAGIGDTPPPVVITTPGQRAAVATRLGANYTARRQPLGEAGVRVVVVFTATHDS